MRTNACYRALRGATWALLAALAACSTSGDEMAWARAALERNDRLEIIAEDSDARTFTVRVRDSGELRVVRVDEISATVVDAGATAPGKAASTASSTDAPAEAAPESAGASPGELASATPPEEESGGAAQVPDTPREPVAATGTGRVIASGPGYSIQAGEKGAAASNAAAEAPAGAAVERRTEPLVCQGSRFLRIDGRNIAFEGDAVVAEEGCELFITNSRITANGVGLAARGASVHIKNSTVVGEGGAIHASGNAQIYAQSSRFSGMVRRLDEAVLHDMGDNVWN